MLKGTGASGGVVEGRARVLYSATQMDALQPGEILVVHTTDVGWTPLFCIAAGVVTELGLWALAWRHVVGNWPFALATFALAALLQRVAPLVDPALRAPRASAGSDPAVPLELIGIDRPFTPADLHAIDIALGLEAARA